MHLKKTITAVSLASISLMLLFVACKKSNNKANTVKAEANLMPVGASTVTGTASFSQQNGEVTLHIAISNATPGIHGMHLHADGDCHTGDQATVGGGHWNPTNSTHGKWGSAAFHRGDIGNITINANGKGILDFKTDLWSLTESNNTEKYILNKSILFHANPDDFTTQPTGAAGARLACGSIKIII